MPLTTFASERLIFRKLTLEDAPEIYFLRSDNAVNKFIKRNKPKRIEDARQFILDRNRDIEEGKLYYWAISIKNTTKLIGSICLWNLSEDGTTAEIGYDLHPTFQKMGYMSEAMKAVMDYGFSVLKLTTIEAFTHRNNRASTKLLESHHFILDLNRVDDGFPDNIIFTCGIKDVLSDQKS